VLPQLRERSGDLWLLAEHFLQKLSIDFHKNIKGFSADARAVLAAYDYPGNVRELENIVARAVALAEGDEIQVQDLPPFLTKRGQGTKPSLRSLEAMEKEHIARVLAASRGHRDQAAAVLGITRSTLWRKMKKYGLNV